MSAHTPGPWVLAKSAAGKYEIVNPELPSFDHRDDMRGKLVAYLLFCLSEADASLISVAPEQHDALLAFVAAYESWQKFAGEWATGAADDPLGAAYTKAKDAVAKATRAQP